ncbi:MAG TPA: sugar phosphate isomerase/epimerase family protein [Phycisphaerae bacterium]|nr:sugar phosphate isomerase/epimerase family protein [Phycisphaerae bacterium]
MRDKARLSRRELMVRGATAMAGAGVATMIGGCEGIGPRESVAAKPAANGKKAWAIACRDAHLRETGAADSWAALKAIGADGAEVFVMSELRCEYLYADDEKFSIADAAAVGALGRRFKDNGLKITSFCLGTRYDQGKDKEIAFTLKVAEVAAVLGVPAVRIDVVPHEIKDESKFIALAVDVGRHLIRETAGSGVRFGVENHGRMTNKVEFLRKLLLEVGDSRFGVTLDTANFYWFGYPLSRLYDFYFEFAPLACHTHAKSIRYPEDEREKQRQVGWEYGQYCCPVYEGDIDFFRVARILRRRGFIGDLCIENESLAKFPADQRGQILRREIDHLRKAAASA